ncbi:MAG TPA: glycosyltransferase family A protein [Candidatus Acidoferrales bacterium]|nr:glycosyltransferase family A protein [Candidatus Acidoferrales bacterium]
MPQVSVILPTRNRERFLATSLRSALAQTFADLEVIVVDDASADGTPGVVERFGDRRVRYIRHPARRGGAAARNAGIGRARGDSIAFLDDDDEWHEEKIARQVELLAASPEAVGVIYTGYSIVDRASGKICGQRIAAARGDLSSALRRENCVGGSSSVLVRKSCLDRVGWFDESLPSFQDYDLWLRLAREFQFDCIARPMLNYSLHPDRIGTDLDALSRGIDLMLRKHGRSRSLRKYLSYRCLSLGVRYCEQGDAARGREACLRAIALYPLEIRHYLNLGLAFFGGKNFRRIKGSPVWRAVARSLGPAA